ncbi:MAG: AAA family ATPase, partial [Gammaproteobacteria bacterium]
ICIDSEATGRTVILISHEIELPQELKSMSAQFELAMPDEKEREKIVRAVADHWVRDNPGRRVVTDRKAFDLLIKNLAGMTVSDTRRLARNAIFNDGAISRSDVDRVMKAKYSLLNRRGVLSFEHDTARFADIGGLSRLKEWLAKRKTVFVEESESKLDPPKGLMLLGVQGCGKSLAAKAAAGIFGVPLLRLDFATLYNKFYGETERNLRESLKTGEVMEPCVLWIDEIEKGIAQGSGDDSSLSRRVLGTFLTWMAEKNARVFVVATANDITSLPPELVRKGRFDEIFFVDLPGREVREQILRIHLGSRDMDPGEFDLGRLAEASDGFSGAEIEQAIVSGLYAAHAIKKKLGTGHVLDEISRTRPLSVTMSEHITSLRAWAADRTVPSD